MTVLYEGPILESEGMRVIFQKKGRKGQKKGKKKKIFKNLDKNVKKMKIFWKRAASYVRLSHVWKS